MRMERLGPLEARIVGGTDGNGGGDGPVVVLLHGFGAPGSDLVDLAGALGAPDGTRFVFPVGPLTLDMGMPGDARAWWMIDMVRFQHAIQTGQIRDMSKEVPEGMAAANEKLNGLLDAVQTTFQVSGSRMVLGGFSQGAMLSLDVALRSDRSLAGLVLFSGTLLAEHQWGPLMPKRKGLRVVQSHGAMDPILPYSLAEDLRERLKAAGWSVEWVPFFGQHQIPLDALRAAGRLLEEVLT